MTKWHLINKGKGAHWVHGAGGIWVNFTERVIPGDQQEAELGKGSLAFLDEVISALKVRCARPQREAPGVPGLGQGQASGGVLASGP